MISHGDTVLVAISGGADSVALLYLLRELCASMSGVNIFAAHFEHGIRGEDSLGDAAFVQELCCRLAVRLFVKHGNVLAESNGRGIEAAAREARYAFFLEAAKACGANVVALAHHKDDQAETCLMRLFRGSGLSGLSGMRPTRPLTPCDNILLVRPFLCVTRKEIEGYIIEKELDYREDATNSDTAYTRNRIRLNLIPMLCEYNPNIISALSHAAESMALDDDALSKEANHIMQRSGELCRYTHYGARIGLDALVPLHQALSRRIIQTIFKRLGISDTTHDQIAGVAAGQAVNLPGGWSCERFRSMLCLISPYGIERMWELEILPVQAILATRLVELSRMDPYCCFISYDALLGFSGRVVIRGRNPGDRIHPLGASGSQKLKRYLIDKGIERPSRDDLPLLVHEADGADASVLWVPGCGISQQVAVSLSKAVNGILSAPNTRILRIRIHQKK